MAGGAGEAAAGLVSAMVLLCSLKPKSCSLSLPQKPSRRNAPLSLSPLARRQAFRISLLGVRFFMCASRNQNHHRAHNAQAAVSRVATGLCREKRYFVGGGYEGKTHTIMQASSSFGGRAAANNTSTRPTARRAAVARRFVAGRAWRWRSDNAKSSWWVCWCV